MVGYQITVITIEKKHIFNEWKKVVVVVYNILELSFFNLCAKRHWNLV